MNLLFPFLMNFSIPIAALLAIWWHLDRAADGDGSAVRHEVAASAWLVLALATSGLGLMTMAAVGVELAVSRAPVAAMGDHGARSPALGGVVPRPPGRERDLHRRPRDPRVLRSHVPGGDHLGGGRIDALGVVLAVGLVGFVVLAGIRWRSLDARTLGALAAPATFIVFTAVTRLDIVPAIPPDELRYSWAVAAYLVLAVVVAARRTPMFDVRVPEGVWIGVMVAAFAVLALGAVRLWDSMEGWNEQVATARPGLSSVLFATEAIGSGTHRPRRGDPPVVRAGHDRRLPGGRGRRRQPDRGCHRCRPGRRPVQPTGRRRAPGRAAGHPGSTRVRIGMCILGSGRSPAGEGELSFQPGDTVELLIGPNEADIRISRFAPIDDGPTLAVPPGTAVVRIELPSDDPSVADLPGLAERFPYRLSGPAGQPVTVCP